MEELPKRFPNREVSADVLAGIARRAREQHAGGAAPDESAPVQRQVSPLVLSLQNWMRGAGLGVLDLAAIAALLGLSVSLAWMYAGGSRQKIADNPQLAAVNPHEKTADLHDPPDVPTVVSDGPDTPKTPEPAPTPGPDPEPQPAPRAELLKLKADPTEAGPPEDVPIPPDLNSALQRQDKVCEICGQPLYKHADPNFQCIPFTQPVGEKRADLPSSPGQQPEVDIRFGLRNGGARRLMVKRHGGSKSSEETVDLALRWLAYHQEADGHWDAVKYAAGQKTDTAVTALAALTFLGAGHTEKVGAYKENVKRAVAWLKSKQDASGLVYDQTDAGAHRGIGYPNAIAALALAEAAGMARVPDTVAAAQKAIDYCTNTQQNSRANGGSGGWRYTPNSPGDICVTGWYVSALKSAKVAQLHVDQRAFDDAILFLDSLETKENGISRYLYMPGTQSNHRRCAIGNFCRQFLGWKKEDLQDSVEAFVREGGVPEWGANGEKVDAYYWYYGTLCTFQQGGEIWKKWNVGMRMALVDNQCRQGDDAGSWPVVGDFSGEWGRVGQTALCALCCEVYYRYQRLQPDAKPDGAQSPGPAEPDRLVQPRVPSVMPPLGDKLKTKVSFNLVDKKLSDTVELLNQLTDVKVKLDDAVHGDASQITLHVTEMPLDLSITWITKLADLDWREENGAIVIGPKKPLQNETKPAPAKTKDEF